jgi:hypothetical protein
MAEENTSTTTALGGALQQSDAKGDESAKGNEGTGKDDATGKAGGGKESSGTQEGASGGTENGSEGKEGDAPGSSAKLPEKYSFAAPEGVTLDPEVTDGLEAFARTHKLSQESAQSIADLGVKLVQKIQTAQQEQHAAIVKGWRDAQTKDPEIGGDRYQENMALAIEGAKNVFTKDELTYLDQSGLGDHPGLVRAMYRLGKFLRQDTPPRKESAMGGGESEQQTLEDIADKMYGKSTKK